MPKAKRQRGRKKRSKRGRRGALLGGKRKRLNNGRFGKR